MYLKIEKNNRGNILINDLIIKKIASEIISSILKQSINLEDININQKNNILSLYINLNINKKNINISQINNKITQELNNTFQKVLNFEFKYIYTIFTNNED